MMPVLVLLGISGIFYPIQDLWRWVQVVAQLFPMYWLGLGMRSAFLPDAAAAAEIGGSWRTLETVLVLGAWATVGLLVAPGVLRRMARRQSGSAGRRRSGRGGAMGQVSCSRITTGISRSVLVWYFSYSGQIETIKRQSLGF